MNNLPSVVERGDLGISGFVLGLTLALCYMQKDRQLGATTKIRENILLTESTGLADGE